MVLSINILKEQLSDRHKTASNKHSDSLQEKHRITTKKASSGWNGACNFGNSKSKIPLQYFGVGDTP